MRPKIKIFENERFGKLRVTLSANGKPLFCSLDLCHMLGLKKNRYLLERSIGKANYEKHVVDYVKLPHHERNYAGEILFLNASGVSQLLSKRKRDDIYEWIVSDVLSYVTKYGLDDAPTAEVAQPIQEEKPTSEQPSGLDGERLDKTLIILRDLLAEIHAKFATQDEYDSMKREYSSMKENFDDLQKNLTQLEREKVIWGMQKSSLNHRLAEAEYLRYFLESLNQENKAFTASEVGQMINMSAVQLNKLLEEMKIIRRVNGEVLLTKQYMGKNYAIFQPIRKTNSQNEVYQLKWTVKGMAFIYAKLKAAGYMLDSEKELIEKMQSM